MVWSGMGNGLSVQPRTSSASLGLLFLSWGFVAVVGDRSPSKDLVYIILESRSMRITLFVCVEGEGLQVNNAKINERAGNTAATNACKAGKPDLD